MTDTAHRRIRSVARRGERILAILRELGPLNLSQLTQELGLKPHEVRYAANALVSDGKAHIHHIERIECSDGVEREVSFYADGPDLMPRSRLDYASTSHLQDLYSVWTKERHEVSAVRSRELGERDEVDH